MTTRSALIRVGVRGCIGTYVDGEGGTVGRDGTLALFDDNEVDSENCAVVPARERDLVVLPIMVLLLLFEEVKLGRGATLRLDVDMDGVDRPIVVAEAVTLPLQD